jgi:hypothetical protein
MLNGMGRYLDLLVSLVQPDSLVMIAVDGEPPDSCPLAAP